MVYQKLISKQVAESTTPYEVFTASNDTIISKIYVHNPSNTDVVVEMFFVDKSNANEFDGVNVIETSTKAFHTIIPTNDTDILGNGLTLTSNQSIFIRVTNGSCIIHLFGKISA
jgi:phage-related baseplate assembly protein